MQPGQLSIRALNRPEPLVTTVLPFWLRDFSTKYARVTGVRWRGH
jgi:hypothetical protein